jgi:ribosome biogenesis protein BRX1
MPKANKRKSSTSASSNGAQKKGRKFRQQEQIDADNNDESLNLHRLGPAPSSSSSLGERLPSTRSSDVIQSMKTSSWVNKQRVLIFSSRGISYLARHVMKNLRSLMAHSKSEPKAELRKNFSVLNEIAELRNCNKVLFFDMKKKRDLYLWMASVPDGPTVKFLVENLHTMEGLKLTGNCLRGSRPVLSFDPKFDDEPHWKLIKELFTQIFGTPKSHPKSQPFIDHVLSFTIIDNKVWLRNYQIIEENGSLAEIGPR